MRSFFLASLLLLAALPASAAPPMSIARALELPSSRGAFDRGLDDVARLIDRLLAPPRAGAVRPWLDCALGLSQAQYLATPHDGARRTDYALGPMLTLGLEGSF